MMTQDLCDISREINKLGTKKDLTTSTLYGLVASLVEEVADVTHVMTDDEKESRFLKKVTHLAKEAKKFSKVVQDTLNTMPDQRQLKLL